MDALLIRVPCTGRGLNLVRDSQVKSWRGKILLFEFKLPNFFFFRILFKSTILRKVKMICEIEIIMEPLSLAEFKLGNYQLTRPMLNLTYAIKHVIYPLSQHYLLCDSNGMARAKRCVRIRAV